MGNRILTPFFQRASSSEEVQDAIGVLVDSTLVYDDMIPSLSRAALTGDVTASTGSNATTIANDAVTYAKMQNVSAEQKILGRGQGSGSGDVQELTLGSGFSVSGTTITGTGTFTTEDAQDAVGAMVDTSLVYVDGTPLLTRAALTGDVTATQGSNTTTIANNAVTDAKLRDSVAVSVIGRSANSSGDPADIAAAGNNTVLKRASNALSFAAVVEDDITLADNTTNNASTSAHGFLKKLDNTATHFLDGTGAWDTVKDSDLSVSDITTNDVTTSAHGFVPKAPNDSTKFFRGDGTWASTGLATATPQGALVVRTSTTQTIANNTLTPVDYDSEVRDDATFYTSASSTSKLTVAVSGWYVIAGYATFVTNTTGIRAIQINLNGGTAIASAHSNPVGSSSPHSMTASAVYYLSASDYVQLSVYQTSGGNLNLSNTPGYYGLFSIVRWI